MNYSEIKQKETKRQNQKKSPSESEAGLCLPSLMKTELLVRNYPPNTLKSPQSSLSAHFQAPLSQLQRPMWVCSKPIKVRKCFLLFPSLHPPTDAVWEVSHC